MLWAVKQSVSSYPKRGSLTIERPVVDPERLEPVEVPVQPTDEPVEVSVFAGRPDDLPSSGIALRSPGVGHSGRLSVVLGGGPRTSPREDNDAGFTSKAPPKSPFGLEVTTGTAFA